MWLPKCPETGKLSFRSAGDAVRWIKGREIPRRCATRTPFRAYSCPHCGHYHLTKQEHKFNHDAVTRKRQIALKRLRSIEHE